MPMTYLDDVFFLAPNFIWEAVNRAPVSGVLVKYKQLCMGMQCS